MKKRLSAVVMVTALIRYGGTQEGVVTTCPRLAVFLIKRCNVRSLAVALCSLHQFFVADSQLGIDPRH